MMARSIIYVPYYFFALLYYANKKVKDRKKALVICKKIVKRALKTGNIKLELIDVDKFPQEDGYLITPNHQGMFDMLVLMEAIKNDLGIVIKKEASNVLVLKQVIQSLESYSIDREDIKQSMKVIINVSKDIKAGRNFVIFPEGTRSKNGNNLNEFKGGSFKAAMKVNAPIVPCAMIDAYKAFDTNSIKQITVTLIVLDPIYSDEYKEMTTTDVAIMVRDRIQTAINEHLRKRDEGLLD